MDKMRKFAEEAKPETRENKGLETAEISSASEMKKMQKGSSVSGSCQTASASAMTNEKELKDKEPWPPFLSIFKFNRNKSVKESSQKSDRYCENNVDIQNFHSSERTTDANLTMSEFAKAKRKELSQETGIEEHIDAGALSMTTLDDGQKKAGRWQHMRTRLQHRMTLPNKPEVNLSLDLILTKKKSIQRRQLQLPSKTRHADNEQVDHSVSSKQSLKHVSNSLKSFWPQKVSLRSSADTISGLDSARAQTTWAERDPNAYDDLNPNHMHIDHLKAAKGGLLSVGKGHLSTSSEFAGVHDISHEIPVHSPHSKGIRKSGSFTFDRDISTNKIAFQNFIQHRQVLRSMANNEQDLNKESHSSQLQISSEADPKKIVESIENEFVFESLDEQNLPSHDYSIDQIHKKTASLPDLINCNPDETISELTNDNEHRMKTIQTLETNRNESQLLINQNSFKIQNIQKNKSPSGVAQRNKNDISSTALQIYNQNDISNEGLSSIIKQRLAPPGEGNGILRKRLRTVSGDRHTISSTVMFARKSHGDIKKSAKKILDPKKDVVTRLKHLRIILDSFDVVEAKAYFEQNFSILYFLFYEGFTNVETNLGQKVTKGLREELDFILLILEKIFVLLPDLIHRRWQIHSIGHIMKKLFHPDNCSKLRREGMRLFVMWYEILMDNATEDCHRMFKNLIPKISSSSSFENSETEFVSAKLFPQSRVVVPSIGPLLPSQAGDVHPDEPCRWLLDCLLDYMVLEVNKVQWNDSGMRECCFKFLFDKFKIHYLLGIFPELICNANIYEPSLELPKRIVLSDGCSKTTALCQVAVIKWITRFTSAPEIQKSRMPEGCLVMGESEPANPESNASTLSVGSLLLDSYSSGSCADKNYKTQERVIVRNVFYSSRENINIIHEVLRQAFLCPFQIHRSCMVRQVINVYRSWFQNDEKPIFMQEPDFCDETNSPGDPGKRQSTTSGRSVQLNTQLDLSSLIPSEDADKKADVRAGLQRTIQVFIANSASLFMSENSFSENNNSAEQQIKLDDRVDICKKVLKMYRYIVTEMNLDETTWKQILMVLLKIISVMMIVGSKISEEQLLARRLAESLFKTMMLAWVKANLTILVSQHLWKNFTETLSSLTNCVHLIQQWSKIMELLTRILSQCIYDVDLRDLPLDKWSKRKVNRLHGANDGSKNLEKDSSLSRNWLKQIMSGAHSTPQSHRPWALTSTVDGPKRNVRPSVGQQSQDAVSYSKCQSQFDLSSLDFPSAVDDSDVPHHLLRCSSDSNILIDSKKHKVPHISISNADEPTNSEDKTDCVFYIDTEENSLQSNDRSEATDDCSNNPKLSAADSIISSDSNILPFSMTVGRSGASDSSFSAELSDRLDAEAPLKMSESGSVLSHKVYQRSVLRSLSESDSNETVAVEGKKDETEVLAHESLAELQSIKTLNESVDDDDDDGATVCDFGGRQMKQDRDSLQMEDDRSFIALCGNISQVSESVLQSGVGHVSENRTSDIVLVLWQRMLGCLGNVNNIKDSEMHARVFKFLSDLLDIFIKIRENQGVTKDNQTTPTQPHLVPPVLLLSSWCFEALKLPEEYNNGKLLAYQILCTSTLQRHDVQLPTDHLQRFLLVLHYGFVHGSQDVVNVLIRYCNSKFFSQSLPGSTLMMLDFVKGAKSVLSEPIDAKNVPRAEAMSLLGSLLYFQNHLRVVSVLDPDSEDLTVIKCSDVRDRILDILLKFAKIEPPGRSRCIAVNALGLYLYEELCRPEILHPKLKDAFIVLLSMLKLTDRTASLTAAHVLTLLSDHIPLLLLKLPEFVCVVVKDMTNAITHLLPAVHSSVSEESKKMVSRILIGVMFTLLEWCIRIPKVLLLSEQNRNETSLIHLVFDALNVVVHGGRKTVPYSGGKILRHSVNSNDQLTSKSFSFTSLTQKMETSNDQLISISPQRIISEDQRNFFGLKSAAKAIMFHLINYFDHFPMSLYDATQMGSNVEEYHDAFLEEAELTDLSTQVLASKNAQFFVMNNMALISFVEIPVQTADQHRATNGLATEKTVCRIISRDPSGKHCWDSSILHGDQQHRSGSNPADPSVLVCIDEEWDNEFEGKDFNGCEEIGSSLSPEDLQSCRAPDDNILDVMLQYLSESSPECLVHSDEEALGVSFGIPAQLSAGVEDATIKQQLQEKKYMRLHTADKRLASKTMKPSEYHDLRSPYQLCRLFLSQFGFAANEKRKTFDLLNKNEKLLRELKHLDNQCCRDTHKFAVIYVGRGQEDKVSILKNTAGSHSFNEFIASLGWQVSLQSHSGFMGGLQRNQTTGSTALYYATSTKEVIFHVSTQMPSETEEDQLRKLRHLGNDEVHIVWSEHTRDYRHGIIPTEFGDVLIVIYPLENGLFRIQIIQRPEVPSFGPLFDGAILNFQVLSGLVRATAISAGQMLRITRPYYRAFYEERMHCIENIIKKFKMLTTFEMFSSQIFAPSPQLDAENISRANSSVDKNQVQLLINISKDEQAEHHKLSPAGGKQKKLKKSASTPPQSPRFDQKQIITR